MVIRIETQTPTLKERSVDVGQTFWNENLELYYKVLPDGSILTVDKYDTFIRESKSPLGFMEAIECEKYFFDKTLDDAILKIKNL